MVLKHKRESIEVGMNWSRPGSAGLMVDGPFLVADVVNKIRFSGVHAENENVAD